MTRHRANRGSRAGLQLKSAMILSLVALGITAAGGWWYYDAARDMLRRSDGRHASSLVTALAVAAQYDLRQGNDLALRRLVSESLRHDNVRYVALLNARGMVVASAGREGEAAPWAHLEKVPVAVSAAWRPSEDLLMLARPVILRDAVWYEDRVVGAVRVVFDTHATTERLAGVLRRMLGVAGAIVLVSIPGGYLLVWHVLLKPLRRLADLTGRLALGDFAARLRLRRRDEIGRLGESFDAMADNLAAMRDELLQANEQLERKVAQRTDELQVANARLRSEITEKEEFLRAVSHDLNAPLRNIAGMAAMVQMKWRDELPKEVVARLQRIQANVDVQTGLIGELLELSRIRSRPQKRAVVDMCELIRGVAETFDFELRKGGIRLEIAEGMPPLWVEPARMRQVFQNLIDNAVKYMHRTEGGWIRVACRRAGSMHEFSVADNGPGIPADQHERIFCVFRRAEGAAASGVSGKGVGLALVRSVVSNYDGRAWVESSEGGGATFFVALSVENTVPPANAGRESADGIAVQAGNCAAGR